MDFNKLTLKSQEAVGAAQELARRMGNPEIYPEHLTLALLDRFDPARRAHCRGTCVCGRLRQQRNRMSQDGASWEEGSVSRARS